MQPTVRVLPNYQDHNHIEFETLYLQIEEQLSFGSTYAQTHKHLRKLIIKVRRT